jgi:NAD(P)H-dependent flavin oxidoreductase YrpB (nitropropane dioxygenase family)
MTVSSSVQPSIIQGGMGVAVSGWELANAVARTGAMGVVSGTALEVVCARRLQLGDPHGHVRRALANFPDQAMAGRVLTDYFVDGGKPDDVPFKNVRSFTLEPAPSLQELTIVANFVEVFLAKEGHDGPVGINFMRKIEIPLIYGLYGAMVAGVDYVLVGAGNPHEIPALMTRLAAQQDVSLPVRVQGTTSADGDVSVRFSPQALFGSELHPMPRPEFLAIVASLDLAAGLASSPQSRPDGFVVEGPPAGGHNAPPRGPRRVDELGQPVYDERDDVDLAALIDLDLPVWLAGAYATPEGLQAALQLGATGIQAGTVFALSSESGLDDGLKRDVLSHVADGSINVRTDWRASPTGFPFKVVQVEGTLSDDDVYLDRRRVCDLGVLRVPHKTPDGNIGYRCPAEPVRAYSEVKGGREANTDERLCLCNGLLATAGLAQKRRSGYVEPPVVTGGTDYQGVADLLAAMPDGQDFYTAADVISYLAGP